MTTGSALAESLDSLSVFHEGFSCNRRNPASRIGGACTRQARSRRTGANTAQAANLLQVPVLTVQRQARSGDYRGAGSERNGVLRAVLLEWLAAGPDRHDLELFNRKNGRVRNAAKVKPKTKGKRISDLTASRTIERTTTGRAS